MNKEEIKAQCQLVTDRVLGCLEPTAIEKVQGKFYIAGGAIASMVLDQLPVDYDMFCDSEEVAAVFKEAWKHPRFPYEAELLANTKNGLTWKLKTGEVVQIVTRFTGGPERVFDSFDFEHCKAYYQPGYYSNTLQVETPARLVCPEELILSRKLIYTGKKDKYTLNTLKRMVKFAHRGWVPDNSTIVNLYTAIQRAPSLDDPAEHAEQTVGFYGSSFT